MASSRVPLNVCLNSVFLGVCRPSLKHDASKFKIQHLLFDNFLKMYFKHSFEIYAHDPKKICKTGDIALIQKLSKSISTSVEHRVVQVLYPCGDVLDPITGQKVSGLKLRDDIEFENLLYGSSESKFNYKQAPQRGWQEGKKDFSHRQLFKKYHEFNEGDENKDHPDSTLD